MSTRQEGRLNQAELLHRGGPGYGHQVSCRRLPCLLLLRRLHLGRLLRHHLLRRPLRGGLLGRHVLLCRQLGGLVSLLSLHRQLVLRRLLLPD